MARKNKLPQRFCSAINYDISFERSKDEDGIPRIFMKCKIHIDHIKHETSVLIADTPEMVDACFHMRLLFENWFRISAFRYLLVFDEEIHGAAVIEAIENEPTLAKAKSMIGDIKTGATSAFKDVEDFMKDRQRRLGIRGKRGGKKRKADLTYLYFYFDEVLASWESAAALYQALQRSKTQRARWRERVSDAFPMLPANLIERLQPAPNWPESIAKQCSEGSSEPKHIAMEHAARQCGARPYEYKMATLEKYIQRGRRMESKPSTEHSS